VTSPADREAAERARVVAQRAIRRLDVLEWVIFGVGGLLAIGGGAVIAWVFRGLGGWPFRETWMATSLLLFVIAGAWAIIKIRKEERADALRATAKPEQDDG
jgi:uncharacterized membrane protein